MKKFFKKLFITFVITLSILPSAASANWWDDWITKPAMQLYKKTAIWAKKHPTAATIVAVSAGVTTVSFLAYVGYSWYSQQKSIPPEIEEHANKETTPSDHSKQQAAYPPLVQETSNTENDAQLLAEMSILDQDPLPSYNETIQKHFNAHKALYQLNDACSSATASTCALRGGALIQQITSDALTPNNFNAYLQQKATEQQISYRMAYQQCFVDICWFAYYHHLAIGTLDAGFEEGSFVFEDRTGNLEAFLYGYLNYIATLIDPTINQPCQLGTCNDLVAANPFAHYRASIEGGEKSMGVTIVDDNAESSMMLLPVGKRHILISVITTNDTKRILFKPENYGFTTATNLVKNHPTTIVKILQCNNNLIPTLIKKLQDIKLISLSKQKLIADFIIKFNYILEDTVRINLIEDLTENLVETKNILNTIATKNNSHISSAIARLQKQLGWPRYLY